jgi:hypothetical protein
MKLKCMKKLVLAAVLFTALITGCKKENCPVPTASLPPLDLSGAIFKGNVTFNGVQSFDNTTITFKGDGVLEYKFPGYASIYPGTWSKTPNSNAVYIVYTADATTVYKGSGTINADGTKLENGTLIRTVGGNGTGTFTMTKQ